MSGRPVAVMPEVTETLASGGALVALESTVIAQGLPWPVNLEVARASERAVRDAGAVPATVAVLGGVIRIGLTEGELVRVAGGSEQTTGALRALSKANRRDLAAVAARGGDTATTVSATLWVTRRYGLEPLVMATGGLGGVHRDASDTFDISTDLDELAPRMVRWSFARG